MITQLGPQVVVIDDVPSEGQPINRYLDKHKVGNIFFNANPAHSVYPDQPIETAEVVFLDLHYRTGFGSTFDATFCATWINTIIPENKKYDLVMWTKDPDKKDEVLEELKVIHKSPSSVVIKQKTDYLAPDKMYNIQKLLSDLNITVELPKVSNSVDFYGQIIHIEEDKILINCLLDEERPTFQVRRFDKAIFDNYIDFKINDFIKISVTTGLGTRTFEFVYVNEDLSEKFQQVDYFQDLQDSFFVNGDNDTE